MENNIATNHENGNDANRLLAVVPCKRHKPKQLEYVAWHEWANKMYKQGREQKQCDKCGRWYFKSEF
jgi:hypothetical protein